MYLVWYILLNIIIFCIFIFPVLYYVYLLNTKSPLILNKSSNLNKSILFKNLFLEYNYFSKFNLVLSNFLIINLLNLKLLNFYKNNYNPYLNYLILNSNNKINYSIQLNFNYFSKIIINNVNLNKVNFDKVYNNIKLSLNKSNKIRLLSISNFFIKSIFNKWIVKFSPSNFLKYINGFNLNNYTILFLRKNKVFNKGRYSRNRQYYRTGVYWCLYVNIIAVVGIYFWFYRFTLNFGYLWWLLYLFIISFIVPKVINFRLYNLKNLFNVYIFNFIWLGNLVNNLFLLILKIFRINIIYFKNFNFFNFRYLNVFEFKLINKVI